MNRRRGARFALDLPRDQIEDGASPSFDVILEDLLKAGRE